MLRCYDATLDTLSLPLRFNRFLNPAARLATRSLISLESRAPLVTETEEASHQLQIPIDFPHNCSVFLS